MKAYIDESLKTKPTVKEMEKSGAPALEPEHEDNDSTNFVRQAEMSFKADMDSYTKYVSEINNKMEHGAIIDLADVTEYNKVVGKYE